MWRIVAQFTRSRSLLLTLLYKRTCVAVLIARVRQLGGVIALMC